MATLSSILAACETLPRAKSGEYELGDKEAKTLRAQLYGINKAGFKRYATRREGALLMVWRIK